MTALAWLIPCALAMGLGGLFAFLWAMRSGQLEDLEGAAWRAITDEEPGGQPPRTGSGAALASRPAREV